MKTSGKFRKVKADFEITKAEGWRLNISGRFSIELSNGKNVTGKFKKDGQSGPWSLTVDEECLDGLGRQYKEASVKEGLNNILPEVIRLFEYRAETEKLF